MRLFILRHFFIILIVLGVDLYIVLRYVSWEIPYNQILAYTLFLLVAEIMLITSVSIYKNFINPYSVFSLFIYTAGFSFIRLADKQNDYSTFYIMLLIVSIICFILGCIIGDKLKMPNFKFRGYGLSKRASFAVLIVFFITGILVFIMEVRQLGYIPILNIGGMSVYDDLIENEVTVLHNFIVLNAIFPAMFLVFYKKKVISFLVFIILTLASIFILMNFMSRQMIMLLFFTLLLAVTYYHRLSMLKLGLIGFIVVFIFISLGELRNNTGEDANATIINDVIKNYTNIEKPTNLIETYHTLYGSVNFSTADKLITSATSDGYFGWGSYFFRPLISMLPVDKSAMYPLKYSSYTQLGTYVVDPYLDLRWFGVVVYNLLYGFLSMKSFKNYSAKKSPYYIIEWGIIMFCIFMASFTSFFHMFFVFFFFMINRLILK